MPSTSSPLFDTVFQGWNDYQKQLVVVLRPLAAEQLAMRVTPDLRSVGEIATHVIAGRAFWFFTILKEGDDEIDALAQWHDPNQPIHTTTELVRGLEATWNLIENALSRWTPAELLESIILPWIGPKYPITRAWVLWHLIEHDLHHGGELTQTLGISGLVVKLPPPPPES